VIRAARPDDGPALQAIDRATWSWDVSPAPVGAAAYRPEETLVAELDGEVAGYVALGAATPLESNRHVVHVRGLAVAPAYQGRGIGRALVEAAVRVARERGARRVTLRVLAPNVAARALYEACGFVVEGVGHEEFLLDGRYVDDVLMARATSTAAG
jgi:ribosomal protein S18 acetylase RimI-like enzyme